MPFVLIGLIHALLGLALLVLGFLALTARKSRRSRHPKVGEAYFWVLTVTLSIGFVIGLVKHPGSWTLFQMMTPPTWIMGAIGYGVAKRKPKHWLLWHINAQGGSYIGVITAFGFQVFPRFLPHTFPFITAYWLLPTAIGSLLIARTIRRWTRRPATAPRSQSAGVHPQSR